MKKIVLLLFGLFVFFWLTYANDYESLILEYYQYISNHEFKNAFDMRTDSNNVKTFEKFKSDYQNISSTRPFNIKKLSNNNYSFYVEYSENNYNEYYFVTKQIVNWKLKSISTKLLDYVPEDINQDYNLLNFSMSDAEVQTMVKKIENNTIKWKNKITNWIYKAEFIKWKNEYWVDDKIKVTAWKKSYTIPMVYKSSNQKVLNDANKLCNWDTCKNDWAGNNDIPKSDFIGMRKTNFNSFLNLSPSNKYLLYWIWWFEWGNSYLINIKNGQKVLDLKWSPSWFKRTEDKQQFVYSCAWWMWENCLWLYTTIKWSFPKIKQISNEMVSWFYQKGDKVYTITFWNNNWRYFKVYSLVNYQELFSKEI